VVVINCQRAGPSTGVPTKTEQGDLWQMLGAAFGDYPRVIAAPLDIGDCFKLIPEIFNIADRFQCPGLVLCDLLLSEGRLSVHPKDLDFSPPIDRGELITNANGNGAQSAAATNGDYKRYKITDSGISPRAVPGVPGHIHTVATDEHMEDGVLISDEFTNPVKRRAMMEKRMRKVAGIEAAVAPPTLLGSRNADVTLIGWGSDPLACAIAWRGDSRNSERLAAHHHRGEQLQRPVCALPAQRNQLCARRPHSQVRRRTLHAAPHCGSSEGTIGGEDATGGEDTTVRAHARNYGLRRRSKWRQAYSVPVN
jgi:pyruvate/2-oxoacid:ferredoxin oxidoreductase alpha subunit